MHLNSDVENDGYEDEDRCEYSMDKNEIPSKIAMGNYEET